MTRELARQALVTAVEALKATWTAYPLLIEYDNRLTVNRATQTNPFLVVKLTYMDGYQTNLGPKGGHRLLGMIELRANVKEGQGSRQANELLEHFYLALHMTDVHPPLRTLAARFASYKPEAGWDAEAALIPFWFDVHPT